MAKWGGAREALVAANKQFIKQLAAVYCRNGHYLLNYEDLVSEGYLLASQLVRVLTTKEFKQDFRAALRNRFKNLVGFASTQSRHANIVDLSEVYDMVGPSGVEEIYQRQKLAHLKEMLSPMARNVLEELVKPSDKTVSLAKREYRKKDNSQFITNGVIRRSLGLTPTQLRVCMLNIKDQIGREGGIE